MVFACVPHTYNTGIAEAEAAEVVIVDTTLKAKE